MTYALDHLSPDDLQILRQRAAQLAQGIRGSQVPDTEIPLEVMVVQLGQNERYALPLSDLVQVIKPAVFALPGVPAEVLGVLSWHGQMICVLDLTRLLGLPPQPDDLHTRVLLLNTQWGVVALKVQAVLELASFAPSSLTSPLVGRPGVRAIHAAHTALLEPALLWERVLGLGLE
jgi:chemotaxis signal transduction protein